MASFVVLAFIALCFLDIWTHHGATTTVPDVIGLNLNRGIDELRQADLKVVVSDSTYTRKSPPGSIVDVIPAPNSIVKAGREVYVTIVAFSPEPIIIDMLLIDTSAKQAEAYLKSKGLNVVKKYVPSEYDDVVVGVKCNGRSLSVGSKVTANDVITLEIGEIPKIEEEEELSPLDMMIESSVDFETTDEGTYGSAETEVHASPAKPAMTPAKQVSNSFGNAKKP